MKKYEYNGETLNFDGTVLNRIRALKDFGNVKAGDIGGWIEKEENLSHRGSCWVYDDAIVRETACVYENAEVRGNSEIFGKAVVHENSKIYENAKVYENSEIYGDAVVHGNAAVHGKTKVCVNAEIYDFAEIYEDAWACGNSKIYGTSKIYGNSEVYGNSKIYGNSTIRGNSKVYDYAEIYANAVIQGTTEIFKYTKIGNDALIESSRDYVFMGPVGRKNRVIEAFKTPNGIMVNVGCFYGGIEEFEAKVKATHGTNKYGIEYLSFAELLRKRFNIKIPQNGRTRCLGESNN